MLKLGIAVAQSTVAKYMPRRNKPPSQTWRTFLRNHMSSAAGIDFFTIPTVTFRVLYGFVVLGHGRRRILHLDVTEHPTAEWTRIQLRAALPEPPRFVHRDRGSAFEGLGDFLHRLGCEEEVVSAPRSPWQNPFAERVIGSTRRDLLDLMIVLGEGHARRLLRRYAEYYNSTRTHLALAKDSPDGRAVSGPEHGPRIVSRPILGGLHHRYQRAA